MDKVIVITGQTGVGKTELSLKLAKKFNGEIINCDASQFRRGLNIGTAKIDLSNIDVKHHLIDILDPNDEFSIKDFQKLAREKITELINKKKTPFIVGGSGLYITATIGDYDLDIQGRNLEFEKQYESFSNEELHKVLEEIDYEGSLIVHPNNRRRVLRAIEASILGNKISENRSGNKLLYDSLNICLTTNRELLYERINKRVDIMFQQGWIDEVKNLKALGINLDTIKDIGYSDINQYLEGNISLEDVKIIIKQKTRNYAKRQMTWFKNKMNCVFVEIDYQNIDNTLNHIDNLIEKFLYQ